MNDIRVFEAVVYKGTTYPPGIYTVDDYDDKATGTCDLDYDIAVNLLVDYPKQVGVIYKRLDLKQHLIDTWGEDFEDNLS